MYCAHTEKGSLQTGTFKLKQGMRLRDILLESSLCSEKAVTGYNVRIFLSDSKLASFYLTSTLGV